MIQRKKLAVSFLAVITLVAADVSARTPRGADVKGEKEVKRGSEARGTRTVERSSETGEINSNPRVRGAAPVVKAGAAAAARNQSTLGGKKVSGPATRGTENAATAALSTLSSGKIFVGRGALGLDSATQSKIEAKLGNSIPSVASALKAAKDDVQVAGLEGYAVLAANSDPSVVGILPNAVRLPSEAGVANASNILSGEAAIKLFGYLNGAAQDCLSADTCIGEVAYGEELKEGGVDTSAYGKACANL